MATTEQLNTALADRYRVERELGAGGMAMVYLAHDLRHDRKVAVKVLKPELAAVLGAERFVVEIKTTASLQHPHILPLFDSGTADGFLYYVMPYIQGETIREKLNRETQFGIEEAVRIAREVADALDYAHRHGVIHRDIKPENILLHDGRAMVMDFGIALAVSAAAGGRMTETGLSLGTPHYMSPEQATADKSLTLRSDVYSLASVLYEMLAGEPPHTAGSAQAVIMKIITDVARPVQQLRRNVPANVAAAVNKALEKLPADRFESAKAFGDALLNPAFVTATSAGRVADTVPQRRGVSSRTFAATAMLAVAALVVAGWRWRRPDAPPPVRARFTLELPDSLAVAANFGQQSLVVAPDGSEFVYPGAGRSGPLLYRRRLNDLAVTAITGTFANPRYSPDGHWLALEAEGGKLRKIAAGGGSQFRIADDAVRASWGDGDLVVFNRGGSLWRTTAGGGNPTRLTTPDSARGERSHTWAFVLPGGEQVLFDIANRDDATIDDAEIAVVRVSDGRITRLGVRGSNPRYLSSGHLLVAHQDGTILGVPFDVSSLRIRGEPAPVLEDVFVKSGGAAMYSVSNNGVLAYVRGQIGSRPAWMDRTGHERASGLPIGRYAHPRLSPTGDRLAYQLRNDANSDIWVLTRATGQVFRLTRDGRSTAPEWSSDGSRIGWTHIGGSEIVWQRADGSGAPDTMRLPAIRPNQFAVAPNGKFLIVTGGTVGANMVVVPLDSSIHEHVVVDGRLRPGTMSISPDSKWVAFVSSETGRAEIYVTNIENPATRLQVSIDNGVEPVWLSHGKRLLYRARTGLTAVTFSFAPRLEVTRRDSLPMSIFVPTNPGDRGYDVDQKTGELAVLHRGDANDRIVVVTGWFEELKEKLTRPAKP